MSTLPELALSVRRLVEALVASDGELTSELEEISDTINSNLPQKVDKYYYVLEELKSYEAYVKERAKEFSDVKRSTSNALERIKQRIKDSMNIMQASELRGEHYRFNLSTSGDKLVINEEELDPDYLKEQIIMIPDKEKIEATLRAGVEVRGAKFEPVQTLRTYVNRK